MITCMMVGSTYNSAGLPPLPLEKSGVWQCEGWWGDDVEWYMEGMISLQAAVQENSVKGDLGYCKTAKCFIPKLITVLHQSGHFYHALKFMDWIWGTIYCSLSAVDHSRGMSQLSYHHICILFHVWMHPLPLSPDVLCWTVYIEPCPQHTSSVT